MKITELIQLLQRCEKRRKELEAENEALKEQNLAYENEIGALCPEDISITEYISALRAKVDRLENEKEELIDFFGDHGLEKENAALKAELQGWKDGKHPSQLFDGAARNADKEEIKALRAKVQELRK